MMKNGNLSRWLRLLFAPAAVLLLGLILLLDPDAASALSGNILGWGLILAGLVGAVNSIHRMERLIPSVLLAMAGGWLLRNPLALAAWLGRLLGLFLLIDGIRDYRANRQAGFGGALPLLIAGIGGVLILLPMTTSRLVFRLIGGALLVLGAVMLLKRLKAPRALEEGEDPNIIDAL